MKQYFDIFLFEGNILTFLKVMKIVNLLSKSGKKNDEQNIKFSYYILLVEIKVNIENMHGR